MQPITAMSRPVRWSVALRTCCNTSSRLNSVRPQLGQATYSTIVLRSPKDWRMP